MADVVKEDVAEMGAHRGSIMRPNKEGTRRKASGETKPLKL